MKIRLIAILVAALVMITFFGITTADDLLATKSKFPTTKLVVPEANLPAGFPKPGKVGTVVIKNYPGYRMARVTGAETSENKMFFSLFNHIKKNDIAMTAPVEMTFEKDKPASMAFLYGNAEIGTAGKNGKVEVVDIPGMTVVSIGFRGDNSLKLFRRNEQKLNVWLKENDSEWKTTGEARLFGYNSPFVPTMLRYNEVQIPVEKVESESVSKSEAAE